MANRIEEIAEGIKGLISTAGDYSHAQIEDDWYLVCINVRNPDNTTACSIDISCDTEMLKALGIEP